MSRYFGYRCYNQEGKVLGWLYTYSEGVTERLVWTNDPETFHWCKRWKREKTAKKHFDYYNQRFQSQTEGGYIQIETMPEIEEDARKTHQQRWNEANPEVVKVANQKYNEKYPVLSFRPTPEICEWLEKERWDENGKPETNAALLIRKLNKLITLEAKGF